MAKLHFKVAKPLNLRQAQKTPKTHWHWQKLQKCQPPHGNRAVHQPSSRQDVFRFSGHGGCKFDHELLKSLSSVGSDADLARSQFWIKYEETASDFDKQFVNRLENIIDISILFAGLFSAVNTAFIIAMQSNIVVVSSSDTAIANISNAGGLTSSPAWTTTLSYASLSTSLLAAFGTLLAKQWLAQFKATRSTHGSLPSRGIHRQRKFDILQNWHFNAILECFPVLLQGSLLLFAISLLGSTWYPYNDVAGVILVTTGAGATIYLVTFFAAMLSPDSPFQSPLSHLPQLFLNCGAQLIQLPRHCLRVSNSPQDSKFISLSISTLAEEAPAVRWLLQISTDPAVVTAVARMVPEVDWPVDFDVSEVAKPLWETFKCCFKVQSNDYNAVSLACSDVDRAYACGKALFHLYSEALYGEPEPNSMLRDILASAEMCLSSTKDLNIPQERSFTFICALISLITQDSNPTPSISVPEGELSWVSHIIPAFLHNGNHDRKAWVELAVSIISKFTPYESMPSKVLADHWVIIALIIGVPINPVDLVKIDKSTAIACLREEVCNFIQPGSPRRGTVIRTTPITDIFALAVDLIFRVLSVERDREMITEYDVNRWIVGLYTMLTTANEGSVWENNSCAIIKVMFRTVDLHSLVKGQTLRRSSECIHYILKDSVESGDAETVGFILPLWLDDSQVKVDRDLCINAITLLLGSSNPRLSHVAFHSFTQVLGSSRHSLQDLLLSNERKLACLSDALFDPLRMVYTVPSSSLAEWDRAVMMNAENKLNTALGYLRVVSTMADNASFHGHLLIRGHVQRCIDVSLDTLTAAEAEAPHRELPFLLLSIVASVGTCFNTSCIEAAVHPSATIVKGCPLEWQTIISALLYIQSALPDDSLDGNHIARIADYIKSIYYQLPHDAPVALREAVEPIAAWIHPTDRSPLDLALVRLLHALGSADMPLIPSGLSSTSTLGSQSGVTSA